MRGEGLCSVFLKIKIALFCVLKESFGLFCNLICFLFEKK